MNNIGFYVTSHKQLNDNTDQLDVVNGCQWAWSNRWRAWQSQSPSGLLVAPDSSAREVSLDVSALLSPVLQPEVAVPELHAALSFQS